MSYHQPGIPGTVKMPVPNPMRQPDDPLIAGKEIYYFGQCIALIEDHGGREGWHLSISCPDRYPTWDEIKVARYKLLPLDRSFAVFLPPPGEYVNVEEQDNVFHVHEVIR